MRARGRPDAPVSPSSDASPAHTPALTAQREELTRMLSTCGAFHMRKASRVVTHFFDEQLAPAGLRSTQLVVLVTLALQGPMAMTPLADALVLNPSTLSRNLRPLERAGLIAVRAGRARQKMASLTRAGEAVIARALPAWTQAQETFLSGVGVANWDGLVALLTTVTVPRPRRGGED